MPAARPDPRIESRETRSGLFISHRGGSRHRYRPSGWTGSSQRSQRAHVPHSSPVCPFISGSSPSMIYLHLLRKVLYQSLFLQPELADAQTNTVPYFSGRVNLHLGYVPKPQNCPYFPWRRTSFPSRLLLESAYSVENSPN